MPAMPIATTMRPLTTPASELSPRCNHTTLPPDPAAARANLTQRVEQAAHALHAARGTALRKGWSLDDCDMTGKGPRDATLAQTRYEYVKSLIPERSSRWTSPPPLIRNPWRACAAGPAMSREAVKAQFSNRILPRPLWLPEAGQYFPVETKPIPANCIARVAAPDGAGGQASLALRLGPAGWRPLGVADAGPGTCALYRRLAVVPDLPTKPAEIRAGSTRYRGAGDLWHRLAPTGDVAVPAVRSAADVLDSVDDTQLLQTAANRFYIPMRDADGRFWLPAEAARISAIEVHDPRRERCLDAVFTLDKRVGNDTVARQYFPVLPTRMVNAAAGSSDELPAAVGHERGRGIGAIDTLLLGGGRRAHLQPAARLAQRWLTTAVIRLAGNAAGRAALAPFLDEWPAHLRARAVERITDVVTDIMLEVNAFNERNGAEMRLVDTIEGNAWFAARDGALHVTSAVLEQPVERVARVLTETLIGKMDRGSRIFPSLPDDAAILRRAGRLATYDPTIMQEVLAWPERKHVANQLAQRYVASADIHHPLSALATPRSDAFGSVDDTDNLSLLLRDSDTVMAFVSALQASDR
ncbi:hypothetical protein OVY01_13765 [Robbsia sp. Bb-Pol-6]|uniref:Uncharacterized protein n=1 Tax=Robbsia betulipollinis TaxID=2981849 RepID=A0ABT3ZP12_9BURK|nr:hypothetical protein [Robbsia betulipollinis]MCY0388283.1 hypothetical protein [Robbsia betulipollinis]